MIVGWIDWLDCFIDRSMDRMTDWYMGGLVDWLNRDFFSRVSYHWTYVNMRISSWTYFRRSRQILDIGSRIHDVWCFCWWVDQAWSCSLVLQPQLYHLHLYFHLFRIFICFIFILSIFFIHSFSLPDIWFFQDVVRIFPFLYSFI